MIYVAKDPHIDHAFSAKSSLGGLHEMLTLPLTLLRDADGHPRRCHIFLEFPTLPVFTVSRNISGCSLLLIDVGHNFCQVLVFTLM